MGWYARQKERSDKAKDWPGGRLAYAKAKTVTKDGKKDTAVVTVGNDHEAGNLIAAMKAYGYGLDQQSGQGLFGGKTRLTFSRSRSNEGPG